MRKIILSAIVQVAVRHERRIESEMEYQRLYNLQR
jgi:hypothetical protein